MGYCDAARDWPACEGLWWDTVTLDVTGQSVRDCGGIL